MISAVVEEGIAASCEYQSLLAELFHSLSQPLTTLHCCLTGSLQKPQSAGRYRKDLQIALQQAKSVVFLSTAIRELVTCEAGHEPPNESDLVACVREVVDELLPVAKSVDLDLSLACCSSCYVKLEASRLRPAVFYVIEFVLTHSRPGSHTIISVAREGSEALLTARMPAPARNKKGVCRKPGDTKFTELHRRVTLAIALRTFESAGGSLQVQRGSGHTTLSIRLPRSYQEPALPLASSSRRCG